MTGKRFTINGQEIIQDKQVWCMANSEHCADVIATAMNELHEENQRLKKEILFFQKELRDCSWKSRELTLSEVEDAIKKIKKYE